MDAMGGLYTGDFVGYRRQTTTELVEALRTGVVAVDTNVLLDLYRYRPQTANDLLAALEAVGDRLVVPYQVVREFWRRHSRSQSSPETAVANLEGALRKNGRSIEDAIAQWGKDLGVSESETQSLKNSASDLIDSLLADASAVLTDGAQGALAGDRYIERIAVLLEGRVTPRLPDAEWEQCVIEGKRRVAEEEPPGYLDAQKEESGRAEGAAGDYLVWYQATRHAAVDGRDLLLITRDQKPDWWWRQGAAFLGPRPELSSEFARLTAGKRLYFMRPQDLLEIAPRAFELAISVDSRRDVESVSDESGDDETTSDWTLEALSLLLDSLDREAPVQARAFREAAHDPDRKVLRERVYELGGYDDDRMLRGFTRPFTRLRENLQYEGRLPSNVKPVFWASYPDGVKASWFTVPPEIPDLLRQLEGQAGE